MENEMSTAQKRAIELNTLCELHGLDIREVKKYRMSHRQLSSMEVIEHCKKYKQYKAKVNNTINNSKETEPKVKTEFEKMCNYYYIVYEYALRYLSNHPDMNEGQVIEYELTHGIIDRNMLIETIKNKVGNNPIELLGVDDREIRILKSIGVTTLEQLQVVPIRVLKSLRGVGEKTLMDLAEACSRVGIQLREY